MIFIMLIQKKIYSKERRDKISQALKIYYKTHTSHRLGKYLSQQTKLKLSIAHKGKKLSEEHKQKIRESVKKWNKEIGMPSEIRRRIAEKLKGRKLSEETKQKISESNKGNTGGWNKGLTITDPRVKIGVKNRTQTIKKLYTEGKLKPWNLGKPWSEEIRKKISLRRKGKTYEQIMGREKATQFKKRLSEWGKRFTGKNNPMYGRYGNKNPHFGKPASHGKHSFRIDIGHYCRSKWEANYARYLLWSNKKYQYEPKTFIITLYNGTNATYTPDFLVEGEWHELKGWENRSDLKKWEFFKEQYPQEKFIFIDRKKYKEIERFHKYIIPNWEF